MEKKTKRNKKILQINVLLSHLYVQTDIGDSSSAIVKIYSQLIEGELFLKELAKIALQKVPAGPLFDSFGPWQVSYPRHYLFLQALNKGDFTPQAAYLLQPSHVHIFCHVKICKWSNAKIKNLYITWPSEISLFFYIFALLLILARSVFNMGYFLRQPKLKIHAGKQRKRRRRYEARVVELFWTTVSELRRKKT